MAIILEKNSVEYLTSYTPVRCDTHFKHNIKLADEFFNKNNISWVSLGSIIEKIQNGMNIKTDYYSMEETDILYLSVSQIKEHGLINKNQNFLIEETRDLSNFFELGENTLLTTRSGTIGIAISTNHSSFDLDEKTYVASGFVIVSKIKENYSADIIANYINLFDVQKYLTAMASGACQKNIAQPIIQNLPIPEVLLTNESNFSKLFFEYENESKLIIENFENFELKLDELKNDISSSVRNKIFEFYN